MEVVPSGVEVDLVSERTIKKTVRDCSYPLSARLFYCKAH